MFLKNFFNWDNKPKPWSSAIEKYEDGTGEVFYLASFQHPEIGKVFVDGASTWDYRIGYAVRFKSFEDAEIALDKSLNFTKTYLLKKQIRRID